MIKRQTCDMCISLNDGVKRTNLGLWCFFFIYAVPKMPFVCRCAAHTPFACVSCMNFIGLFRFAQIQISFLNMPLGTILFLERFLYGLRGSLKANDFAVFVGLHAHQKVYAVKSFCATIFVKFVAP